MTGKRFFDVFASGIGLFLLLPVFLIIAFAIKVDSRGPVFFRQERVGLHGRTFRIHKFRTMVVDAEQRGLQITVGSDARITRVGRFLRRSKLDELAQLIDVIEGTMSLVGPRPEVPKYIALYPERARQLILSVRPGITDRASIEFKNESEVISRAKNPHQAYVEEVMPIKIRYYLEYVERRSFLGDVKIILATLLAIIR